MRRDMSMAGVGAVAFAVPLVVGVTLLGPKGGRYSDTEMASFLAQPAVGFIISIGLLAVSIGGLILLMAYLSDAWLGVGRLRRISWGRQRGRGRFIPHRLGTLPLPCERDRLRRSGH